MKKIVFHSFYRDPDFESLKHALLYFDKVVIPKNAFVLTFSESARDTHYIQLLPDEAWEHVEYLVQQGVAELRDFSQGGPDPIVFYEAIVDNINRAPSYGPYEVSDLQSILDLGGLQYEDENGVEFIMQVTCMMAAFFLKEMTQGTGTPFMDNPVIYDALGFGMSGLLSTGRIASAYSASQIRELKARILAQRSLALELPRFTLKSFDDVLELKQRLSTELSAFDERIAELADLVDSQPWDPGFLATVDGFIERKVKPELEDVRRRASASGTDLVKSIWTSARGSAGLAIALYRMWPQLLELVAAGAAATTVLQVLKDLSDKEEQEVSKSGLRFLLKAK